MAEEEWWKAYLAMQVEVRMIGLCSQMGCVMSEGQYGKREKGRGEVVRGMVDHA